MFTSDKERALKGCLLYGCAALFFAVLGFVYELFSHEVYSYYMIYHFGKSTTPDRPDQTWVNCLNLFVAGYTV